MITTMGLEKQWSNKVLTHCLQIRLIIVNKWGVFAVVSVNQYWLLYCNAHQMEKASVSIIFLNGLSRTWLLTDKDLQLWTETEQDQIWDNRTDFTIQTLFYFFPILYLRETWEFMTHAKIVLDMQRVWARCSRLWVRISSDLTLKCQVIL